MHQSLYLFFNIRVLGAPDFYDVFLCSCLCRIHSSYPYLCFLDEYRLFEYNKVGSPITFIGFGLNIRRVVVPHLKISRK